MMRLAFFNHSHPRMNHVSAVRLWGFAKALARRGHRILHVTATLEREESTCPHGELSERLRRHDWSEPFHLAVRPSEEWVLRTIRKDSVPSLVRKPLTGYSMIFRGGVFFDWTRSVGRYMRAIAGDFVPDAAWGTFGNASNLAAARAMARVTPCPLVVDVKDSVFAFVPKGAGIVARPYRRASAATVNAKVLLDSAAFLTHRQADVVYSGVDEAFFDPERSPVPPDERIFRITLTGSLRSRKRLAEFLAGCDRLRERLEGVRRVVLQYAGNEHVELHEVCRELGIEGWVSHAGYLSTPELASMVRHASVNAYISAAQAGFHHKFLELVSTGRPLIAYGGELPESLDLVRGLDVAVFDPRDGNELDAAFDRILDPGEAAARRAPISIFGWEEQARRLEPVFRRAIEEAT
jgi:glycosyltransferase involved in cell wall biosynthesis